MPTVRTNAVRNRLIGDARKALEQAAGSNQIVSKTEAKKLPADVADAVAAAREEKARVTVDDAVDKYASIVSRVLAAVDKRGKGTLSEAEAKRIYDPELRARVLDIRASLAAGGTPPVTDDNSALFDRLKELSGGLALSSGGGVDANLKAFISDTTTSDPLTGEVVQGLLAPQWDTLKRGIWAGGEDLDCFQPALGDPNNVTSSRLNRADGTATLDEFAGTATPYREFVDYLRGNLSELTVVDFYEKTPDGFADCGHSARFIGGKTPDGHLAGVFTGRFVE